MSDAVVPHKARSSAPLTSAASVGWLRRFAESDMFYSFRRSRLTMVAAAVTLLFFLVAILAPLLAVQNPFDPAQLQLMNSRIAPLWTTDGQSPFLLGTDEQGRDVFSAILYGLRISLTVGVLGMLFAGALGIMLGLIAGYVGGAVDGLIMRIADVQLTFPAILTALIINGVVQSVLGNRLDAMSTPGMPDTMPSLGTLIRIGHNYLFAGEWWIVAFPGIALAGLILAINLLGDWLRDALNPKLR